MKVTLALLTAGMACTLSALPFYAIGQHIDDTKAINHSIGVCGANATLISVIQGQTDVSPEKGKTHIIEGVITGFRDNGFFVQEEVSDSDNNPLTSEGVFVSGTTALPNGHLVRLRGEVNERSGLTTMIQDQSISVIDCGSTPSVTVVKLALPFSVDLESVEGMLVSVNDATVTSTNKLWRFGELVVSDAVKRQPSDVAAPKSTAFEAAQAEADSNLLVIEDNSGDQFPETLSFYPDLSYDSSISIGDTVSASGPLNYNFGVFRINPTKHIKINSIREVAPTITKGNLSIATFNVLNYFNGITTSEGDVTFSYDANRGAKNALAFKLQQNRIVEAITSLDADIIGLMEIENDGFSKDSAIQSLVDNVNAHLAQREHYAFVRTSDGSSIGTDAITVGLIYRPEVVNVDSAPLIVPMPEQRIDGSQKARMRPSLIQRFTHIKTNTSIAVAVNHFKSKGSPCAEDVAIDTSKVDDIQGRCNAFRVSAAITLGQALTDERLPQRKVILGDFNAYSAEDPIAVLTDYTPQKRGYTVKTAVNTAMNSGRAVDVKTNFGYHNLAEAFDEDGFSYWFYGTEQVGSLDHMLVSDSLLADTIDATHWNINSVELYQLQYNQAMRIETERGNNTFAKVGPFRSSDHDPFIATFNLVSEPEHSAKNTYANTSNKSGGVFAQILALLAVLLYVRRIKR